MQSKRLWMLCKQLALTGISLLMVMLALLSGAGCRPAPEAATGDSMPDRKSTLIGVWEKVTDAPCARVYPTRLEFREGGLYAGTGAQAGPVPGWDTGTYNVISATHVRISTLNDAIITYQYSISGDTLTFKDPAGCEFQYRKAQ